MKVLWQMRASPERNDSIQTLEILFKELRSL